MRYQNKHEQKQEKLTQEKAKENHLREKNYSLIDREFPLVENRGRLAVCVRCNCVISDFEPCDDSFGAGEFNHPKVDKNNKPCKCPNAGLTFLPSSPEIVPFMKKSRRRYLKRNGIRA